MPVPPPCLDDAAFSASSWVRIRCTLRCSAPLSDALSEAPSGDVTEGEVPGSAQAAMPRSTRSVPDARRWATFPNDIGSSLHRMRMTALAGARRDCVRGQGYNCLHGGARYFPPWLRPSVGCRD